MERFLPVDYDLESKIKRRLAKLDDYDLKFGAYNRPSMSAMDKIQWKLHYLGSHSYVTRKWWPVEKTFHKKHPNRE